MKVKARVSKASDEVSGAGTPGVRIDLLLGSWMPVKTHIHFDSAVFLLSLRAECLLALSINVPPHPRHLCLLPRQRCCAGS